MLHSRVRSIYAADCDVGVDYSHALHALRSIPNYHDPEDQNHVGGRFGAHVCVQNYDFYLDDF